jgi:hypothetical protein
LASSTQLPTAVNVTTPSEIEQVPLDLISTVKVPLDLLSTVIRTLSPDDAVAVGVYVPPTTAFLGAVEVKLIVCEASCFGVHCAYRVSEAGIVIDCPFV